MNPLPFTTQAVRPRARVSAEASSRAREPTSCALRESPLSPSFPLDSPRHAFTVLHKTWMFLFKSSLRASLQDIDVFGLLFAAVSHDLEHPGTTNNFQVNSMTDLALMYNDVSVLEVRLMGAPTRGPCSPPPLRALSHQVVTVHPQSAFRRPHGCVRLGPCLSSPEPPLLGGVPHRDAPGLRGPRGPGEG